MQAKFSRLFDDTSQVPYVIVLAVYEHEFGYLPVGPDGVFVVFEEHAIASTCIAQVHPAQFISRTEGSVGCSGSNTRDSKRSSSARCAAPRRLTLGSMSCRARSQDEALKVDYLSRWTMQSGRRSC